jgi:RNA polymerase sigma factor (sigma-70 family)
MIAAGKPVALPSAKDIDFAGSFIEARPDLLRFLFSRLRCQATAEDIAQDVYLRLLTSKIVASQPRSLMFRTAANLASNHVRDERRRAEIREHDWLPTATLTEEQTPECHALARDALHRLACELSKWPTRTREIFILNRYDGCTQREIADQLKVSLTVIERHMTRAILKLAAWLEVDDAAARL